MITPSTEQLISLITKFRTTLTDVQEAQVATTALTIFTTANPPVSAVVAVGKAIQQLGF